MKAILPVLDKSLQDPYYMQLYRYLKQAITRGEIAADERLPSLRSLSKTTGLSITTIEKAYDQLLVEGYIYSRAQSGFYAGQVSDAGSITVPYENEMYCHQLSYDAAPDDANPDAAAADHPAIGNASLTEAAGASGSYPAAEESGPSHPFLYDPECFDFNKWKKCMNRVLNESSHALFFEGSPQGEAVLRYQIARYLYQSRGVSCHPDQIVIGAGTQQITGHLSTILRSLHVEHVALEDPGYAPVRNTFRDRGFAITSVAVAQDGLMLEKLPANIRAAVYVSPSNHSFTGSVMPIGRRYELIRWAISNDSYIIEDDYDSELRYFGRPIPALKSLTDDDRVIYLGSFSSTLFAAVKISYMVLPPQIASDFYSRLEGYSQTCSKLEQLSLAMFMETGAYRTHIRKLRKLYAQKLDLVMDTLRRDGAGFLRVRNAASGIQVPLEVDSAKSPEALKKDAASLGIPVSVHDQLLLLYYHQIPLEEISGRLSRLLRLWRSESNVSTAAAASANSTPGINPGGRKRRAIT